MAITRKPIGRFRKSATLAIALALLLLGATTTAALAQGATWLDSTPKDWNVSGMAPTKAPPLQNANPNCRTREVAPSGAEESQLSGMGWKLESYWPALQSGDLTLVTALADYDGMCRPLEFNVFVFAGGKYAGTLSPVNMNSRTDGVLDTPNGKSGVTVQANGTIQAVFTRYASSDPLCCPSRGTTTVTYQVQTPSGGPVVVPLTLQGAAPAATAVRPAQIPAQMPATGGGGGQSSLPFALATAGAALLMVRVLWRRSRSPWR
jgi:hypothetical protein